MSKASKKSRSRFNDRRERLERRFVAGSSSHPFMVYALAWVGALALGIAVYGMFFAKSENLLGEFKGVSTPFVVGAIGLVALGVAVWFGSSGLPTLRVGDAGVAIESGEVRRMPWYLVNRIEWSESKQAILVVGKDANERLLDFDVPVRGHGVAAAWLVKEAADRIPKKVTISSAVKSKLPRAEDDASSQIVRLEPLQVVGRKCAASGKVIGYEPDGRVCNVCERVYLVEHAPQRCKCGASMKDGSRPTKKKNETPEPDEAPDAPTAETASSPDIDEASA